MSIKDIFRRSGDTSNEENEYYDEDDGYNDNYEDSYYENEQSEYSPSMDYDFGYDISSKRQTNYSSQPQKKETKYSSAKYTKKQGTNIYQMNSTPTPENKIKRVVYFVLEDAEDARNIADCMIKKDSIVLADITHLSAEDSLRVLNFLDGVRYICGSSIENISNIHLIVPDNVELTGDFFEQMNRESY